MGLTFINKLLPSSTSRSNEERLSSHGIIKGDLLSPVFCFQKSRLLHKVTRVLRVVTIEVTYTISCLKLCEVDAMRKEEWLQVTVLLERRGHTCEDEQRRMTSLHCNSIEDLSAQVEQMCHVLWGPVPCITTEIACMDARCKYVSEQLGWGSRKP